jgi:hypothetical protein
MKTILSLVLVINCVIVFAQGPKHQIPSESAEKELTIANSKLKEGSYPKAFVYNTSKPNKVFLWNNIGNIHEIDDYMNNQASENEYNIGDTSFFMMGENTDTIVMKSYKDLAKTLIFNQGKGKSIFNKTDTFVVFYYYNEKLALILKEPFEYLESLSKDENSGILLIKVYPESKKTNK